MEAMQAARAWEQATVGSAGRVLEVMNTLGVRPNLAGFGAASDLYETPAIRTARLTHLSPAALESAIRLLEMGNRRATGSPEPANSSW